jgi:hypothetical protein
MEADLRVKLEAEEEAQEGRDTEDTVMVTQTKKPKVIPPPRKQPLVPLSLSRQELH